MLETVVQIAEIDFLSANRCDIHFDGSVVPGNQQRAYSRTSRKRSAQVTSAGRYRKCITVAGKIVLKYDSLQLINLPDGVEAVKLNGNEEDRSPDQKEQIAAPAFNVAANPPSGEGVQFAPATGHRQTAVLNAFKHAWNGYRKYAWGHDHVKPISRKYQDWFNLGLTIVDSLDTLWIMNMKKGTC